METLEKITFEQVGADFSLDKLLAARVRSQAAVETLSSLIKPGMTEEEANILAKQALFDLGMEREWHPTRVRFGENTLKTFREPSNPNTVLQENDIYFIDIGPVFDGHEGDSGDTFVIGDDPDMKACAKAVKEVFEKVKQCWLTQDLSGKALYEYAEHTAQAMGWQLNLGTPGHRIGDFPHSIYKANRLATLDFIPCSALWVLEIQIRHPTKNFGAFYEDLLLSNEH